MSRLRLTQEHVEAALVGGSFLGGGGGGSMAKGRILGEAALAAGPVELVSLDEIDSESVLLTCSAVGAPAAKASMVKPEATVRVIELIKELGVPTPAGLITNENGGGSTFNGWLPAAMSGLPIIDAPCNGRAHPTGTMGSMALHRDKKFISCQAAAGGNPDAGRYLEASFRGPMESVAALVRQCAVQAGGLVAVARNPVRAQYVQKFAAPGGIRLAIETGMRMRSAIARGAEAVAQAAVDFLGGSIIAQGTVDSLELTTEGGFDHGIIMAGGCELTFWNEYMTLERDGTRLGTFPDLIMTLDGTTGMPVTTAGLHPGQHVIVTLVPARNIPLGAGMFCRELLSPIEDIVRKSILPYAELKD
ncbi:MAG: DUF917 family protein [Pyramidobacter sp.]|nr:DUF917 family protein [Pyramidobacter sp.]